MIHLCHNKQATKLRFWGKILGTKKDYYIVEGVYENPEDPPEMAAHIENRGTGINKLTYWVTTTRNSLKLNFSWSRLA